MFKTFLYIAIVFLTTTIHLNSKDIFRRLCSQKEVIFKSVDSSLFVLKTDYLLVGNSGEEYGFNGADKFGTSFFVGLNIEGNVLLPSLSQKPWNLDSNYQVFASIDTLKPKISEIQLFDLTANEIHKQDSMMSVSQYGWNLCYFQMPMEYPSLSILEEVSESWIVLISFNEEKFKNDTLDIIYNIYKEDFEFMKGNKIYLDSTLMNDITLIGGAVYGVKYSNGKAHFFPTAVLYYELDSKIWSVEKIFKSESTLSPSRKKKVIKEKYQNENPWWKFWLWF